VWPQTKSDMRDRYFKWSPFCTVSGTRALILRCPARVVESSD